MMRLYRFFYNRQAKAGAQPVIYVRCAEKPLEQARLVFLRNAHALVGHGDQHLAALAPHTQGNGLAGRRVLGRITQQVVDDVVQQALVHFDGVVIVKVVLEGHHVLLAAGEFEGRHQLFAKRAQLHLAAAVGQRAGLGFAYGQHIVDHRRHALHRAFHTVKDAGAILRAKAFGIMLDQFGRGEDGRQRGAELMRSHRHEPGLHVGQFLFALQRVHQLGLGQLAPADVDAAAYHAHGAAVRIALHHLAAALHPHPFAAGLGHPRLDAVLGILALEVASRRVDDRLPFIRVDQRQRLVKRYIGHARRRAAHFRPNFVDIDDDAFLGPLPDRQLRSAHGETQALPGLPHLPGQGDIYRVQREFV